LYDLPFTVDARGVLTVETGEPCETQLKHLPGKNKPSFPFLVENATDALKLQTSKLGGDCVCERCGDETDHDNQREAQRGEPLVFLNRVGGCERGDV